MEIDARLLHAKQKLVSLSYSVWMKKGNVPLTIADHDAEKGTVTIIFQMSAPQPLNLVAKEEGEEIADFVGPLGVASHFEGVKKAAVVGGGVGCAIAYPQAKQLHEDGVEVHTIAGFRNKDIVILEKEMGEVSNQLIMATDDGSYGKHGFVTDVLREMIEVGNQYDVVIAIGPIPMMKAVSALTKPYGIKNNGFFNPIMVDGTECAAVAVLRLTENPFRLCRWGQILTDTWLILTS